MGVRIKCVYLLGAALAVAGYLAGVGGVTPPARAGPAAQGAPTPTATAAAAAPQSTVIAPDVSDVDPEERQVNPETSFAEAESRDATNDADGDGPPVTAIGIATGAVVTAGVLVIGVAVSLIRRRSQAP